MPTRKSFFIVVFTILLIAGFFRFFALPDYPPGLYPDEAVNGNNAFEALRGESGGFKVFYPENNGREGLFINIQAMALKLFLSVTPQGLPEPWMLRIPSALFGTLTVLGIFFLARELSRKNGTDEKASFTIGMLSAFFVATSFWHINFSRIGFRAIMAPFFLTWGTYLLIFSADKIKKLQPSMKLRRAEKTKSKLKAPLLMLAGGAVYGLGMHSYIAYRATPLLILFVFWWLAAKNGWRDTLKAFGFFVLGALIVTFPLISYFAGHPADFLGRTTQISVFSSAEPLKDLGINILKTAQMFFFVGDGNWRHNLAGAPQLFPPVAFVFAVGIILGITAIASRRKIDFMFSFLFAWLIVAALPVVISNEGLPHALRAILMIPPVYILAGAGAHFAWKWLLARIHRRVARVFFSIFLTLVLFNAYYSYFILWGDRSETADAFTRDFVKTARMMNELPKPTPKYVVVEGTGTDVRGIPMSAQTVMFLTDSFTAKEREEKNIHYLLPDERGQIPDGAAVFTIR